MQKVFLITTGITPAVGSQSSVRLYWSGGRGWLQVAGTFSGPTAKLNVQSVGRDGADGSVGSFAESPHPDFPTGITAPGLYRFENPAGFIVFSSPPLSGSDNLTYELKAVVVD